jgi:hypothetical protein
MDVGIWMSREVLEDKLALARERNPEAAWNLYRWPSGFVEGEENRLFVASEGAWRGYFKLADGALLNPNDPTAGYTLLFDTRTWTEIAPVPVGRFRGFTYKVPALLADEPPREASARTPSAPTNST